MVIVTLFLDVHQLDIDVDVDVNSSPMHPLGRGAAPHPKPIGLPLLSGGSGGSNPMQGRFTIYFNYLLGCVKLLIT